MSSPFGHPPVLYSQLHTHSNDMNNDDSAESIVTPPAMIVGLENLLIFCYSAENDDNVFVYMNHDDAEETEEAENKTENDSLKSMFGNIQKSHSNFPPLDVNPYFASPNEQQIMSNPNQLSISSPFDRGQQPPDIGWHFSVSNRPFPNVNEQSLKPTQSLFKNTAPPDLNQLLVSMHKKQPEIAPMPSSLDQTADSTESTTNAIPLTWSI